MANETEEFTLYSDTENIHDGRPHLALRIPGKPKEKKEIPKMELPYPYGRAIYIQAPRFKGMGLHIPDEDYEKKQTVHRTKLHQYVSDGAVEKTEQLLDSLKDLEKKTLLDQKDSQQQTPLHIAAKYDYLRIMELLLDHGADKHAMGEDNETPLHTAAMSNHQLRYKTSCQNRKDLFDPNKQRIGIPRTEKLPDGTLKPVELPPILKRQSASDDLVKDDENQTHSGAVSLLIRRGANYNAEDKYHMTPLHYAAISGNLVALQALMACPNINLMAQDTEGNTPLHYAATHSQTEFCRSLFRHFFVENVDFNIKNNSREQRTPLHNAAHNGGTEIVYMILLIAAQKGRPALQKILLNQDKEGNHCLLLATEKGQYDMVRLIIETAEEAFGDENVYKVVNAPNKMMVCPIHNAALHEHTEPLDIIWKNGACVDQEDTELETPLHKAVSKKSLNAVKYLAMLNANLNKQNKNNVTPLMMAAASGCTDIVHYLLLFKEEIKVDIVDNDGKTALYFASENDHPETLKLLLNHLNETGMLRLINESDHLDNTSLHVAAMHGHLQITEMLLKYNINCELKNHKDSTALHLATKMGRKRIVDAIVKHDVSAIHSTDEGNNTALHIAAREGHENLCKYLIENGAIVGAKNYRMLTPLDLAANEGNAQTVKMLLDHNAPIEPKDLGEYSPLNLAAKKGHNKVVSLLIEKGADVSSRDFKNHNCLDIAIKHRHADTVMAIINSSQWEDALSNITVKKGMKDVRPLQPEHLQTPLRKMICHMPECAELVFNRCITPLTGDDYEHKDFKAEFNYKYLDDYDHLCNHLKTEKIKKRAKGSGDEDWSCFDCFGRVHRSRGYMSNHPLNLMIENERTDLLDHPLVQCLLAHKWKQIGCKVYVINLIFYAAFVSLLTAYIILAEAPYEHLPILGNSTNTTNSTNFTDFTDCEKFTGMKGSRSEFLTIATYFLEVFAIINFIRLWIEFIHAKGKYFPYIEWIMELAVYVLTFLLVVDLYTCQNEIDFRQGWQWVCGSVAIFLAWMQLLMFLQIIPIYGIYSVMFKQVNTTFFSFMPIMGMFIVAFAFGFYALVRNKGAFSNFWVALMKSTIMLTGELEYGDFFKKSEDEEPDEDNPKNGTDINIHDESVQFYEVTIIFFLLFALAMTITMSNMLTSLAIEDVKEEKERAKWTRKMLKVRMALDSEKMIMAYFLRGYEYYFCSCPCNIGKDREQLCPNDINYFEKREKRLRLIPTGKEIKKSLEKEFDMLDTDEGVMAIRKSLQKVHRDVQRLNQLMVHLMTSWDVEPNEARLEELV